MLFRQPKRYFCILLFSSFSQPSFYPSIGHCNSYYSPKTMSLSVYTRTNFFAKHSTMSPRFSFWHRVSVSWSRSLRNDVHVAPSVITSLRFWLSANIFLLPLFSKDHFAGHTFLDWWLFFLALCSDFCFYLWEVYRQPNSTSLVCNWSLSVSFKIYLAWVSSNFMTVYAHVTKKSSLLSMVLSVCLDAFLWSHVEKFQPLLLLFVYFFSLILSILSIWVSE